MTLGERYTATQLGYRTAFTTSRSKILGYMMIRSSSLTELASLY